MAVQAVEDVYSVCNDKDALTLLAEITTYVRRTDAPPYPQE